MNKQSYGKKILSMFLALAMVFGWMGMIRLSAKAETAKAAETKVLAEELEGYNRIVASDFEESNHQRRGTQYQLANAAKTYYVGNYNGKNYLDVDLNLEGIASNAQCFRYMGNRADLSIYKGAFMIWMSQVGDMYFVNFGYQDMDTNVNTVVATKTLTAAEYGIEDATSDFNVKILTDIRQSATDESKETVAYQFWLNDIFVCEGSFDEIAHERMGLCAQVTVDNTFTVKNPGEKQEVKPTDPFAGYERITLADYNTTLNGALTASLAHGTQLTYQGTGDLNKTYVDLDVNYNGNVHYSNFMLRFYGSDRYKDSYHLSWETSDTLIITHYDNAQNFTVLDRVKNLSDYGISGPSDWFNVKLKFAITPNADDSTKQTVKLQLYLNNKLAWEKSVEEVNAASNRNKIFVNANGGTISARVPMDVNEELKGYTPITLEHYGNSNGARTEENGQYLISMPNGGHAFATKVSTYNKTYLNVDVNFNGLATGKGGANVRFQAPGTYGDRFRDTYALGWNTDGTTLHFFRYNKDQGTEDLAMNIVAADFGISGPDAWFNVKLRTDITGEGTTQQTATIQLWLNDRLAWMGTITENRISASRTAIYATTQGGKTILMRSPIYTMEEAMEGYTPITLNDYNGITMLNENGMAVTTVAAPGTLTTQTASFDKTYLDMDVKFKGATGYGGNNVQFHASARYNDGFALGWNADGTTLHFYRYNEVPKDVTIADITASNFGISSASDWFNVKLRTDIIGEGTTSQTVRLELWLNNKLAWTGIIEETRKAASRALIGTAGTVQLRSAAPSVEEELKGYTRVTLEDVEGLGAARAEEGTTYLSAKSGKYLGGNLDKTYLDMDVQSTAGCFLTYLMSENTFWGNDRYQFELTGTNLKITPVYSGAGGTAVTLGLGTLGYTEGAMFNLKIRTDVDGKTVVMQFWFNDKYVAKLTFTEPTARTMQYMGIRGTGTGATVVRMPAVGTVREEVSYDLSKGAYLLTGADYFYVNGKKMPSGTALAAPNDYVIERIVDGKIADSKLVSLYYLGDVNLDGSAFEAGDPVWKDGYALEALLKYGTPMKAALAAADINNDGKVTQADFVEFGKIREDVSLKDEILSKYYTDSLSYDYLGGKDVMPIGGFYGPTTDATLTDGMFKLIQESGINLITYSPADAASDPNRVQQALVLAEKYGIGMFVSDGALNVLQTDENGNVTGHTVVTSPEELAANMAAYSNYDSFLGINIVDEPKGANDWNVDTNEMEEIADTNYKRYNYYRQLAQALKPYVNITNYVNMHGSQSVDKGTYATYVEEIAKDVNVLSFDTYPYFEKDAYTQLTRLAAYLESLDIVRQAALDSGKPFWSFVQAGTDYRDDGSNAATAGYYTEADTLWIVNTSLAFGAKGIQYFPLLQPEHFSYNGDGHDYDRNGIIGANNEVTRYYAMVQKANNQIAAIDHVLMNAQSAGVIVTGQAKTDVSTAALGRNHTFTGMLNRGTTYTEMLNNVSGGDAMVGCFNYQGYEAYYVVNYSRTNSQTITLSLNDNAKYYTIADAVKTTGQGSSIALTVPAGAGVLVVLETLHTHSHGDWVVTTPATLAAVGQKEKTCVCGDKITEEIPKLAAVNEYGVTLRDDLSMNFKMDVDESIKDTAQVVITVGNKTTTQSVKDVVSVNVSAAQMNDTITIQVVNGNDKSEEQTFTVLEYAKSVLADESLSQYHQMVKEMLNYGGHAQVYFVHNTENLVNEGLENVGVQDVPADAAPEKVVSGEIEGISFYGTSLLLRNKVVLRFYFTVTGDIADYTFKINGKEVGYGQKNGMYYIEAEDIVPQDLDASVKAVVNETLTITYSPMNYIVPMSTNGAQSLQTLMKALYNYYLAAEALTAVTQ